jgi:NAD-dependent dihydropyrimidine dehydrogenase PreA subunit
MLSALPVVSLLLLGAHALRTQGAGAALFWLGLAALAWVRWAWVRIVLVLALAWGAVIQAGTALDLVRFRLALGEPWLRLAFILAGVVALTLGSALWMASARAARRYDRDRDTAWPQALALVLTVAALLVARAKTSFPVLLADRLPASWGEFGRLGWLEALALGVYAAWLAGKFLAPGASVRLRPRVWALFSAVFFGQLLLGLAGVEALLMTGTLHLPVPALIAAGPVFRGGGYFMPILFGVTLLLVGPAWCSHLCYIGAWDDAMSRVRSLVPRPLPGWAAWTRPGLLVLVVAAAWAMRRAGTPPSVAALWAGGFGLAGVGVMVLVSRRLGLMAHCTAFCPMGVVANLLGKISPWRLAISAECTRCRACSRACRSNALTPADLDRNRPGLSCTLCGDCLPACKHGHLGYRFPGSSPEKARAAFLVLVVSLHAVFLGVARI